MRVGAGDAADFSCGIEEYANIRFQAKLREKGTFYGAVNLFAGAGDYAFAMSGMGFNSVGENFIAGIELERLYFKLNGEHTDFDGGLFRLPFGYSQVWGPSDFINPKNPLKPDARPRGILGASLSWYPNDDLKLLGFSAAPRKPFSQNAEGWLMGITAEQHWERTSLQALYSYEMPMSGSEIGIHRAGLSLKADLEVAFILDFLYTYNHEAETRFDGFSISAGVDYSFFEGKLIVLAEYLYNGAASSTAYDFDKNKLGFNNNHYLYTGLTWLINDFTNVSLALISGFDDVSFTPVISVTNELFQGASLTVSAQVPLDRDLFSGSGKRGEFGPIPPDHLQPFLPERLGSYFNLSARLRLRF